MKKIDPKSIREIVHLREMNISERETARRTFTSKGSVGRVWTKAKDNGWKSDVLQKLTDKEVTELFYPNVEHRDESKPIPDFQAIHTNLSKYKYRSLYHEWYKFRKEHPDTYSYPWTTVLYNRWCAIHKVKPVLLSNEPEGECMYVDWSGRKLRFQFDGSQQPTEVHFFVSTFGASQYPYVEPTRDETQETLVQCHVNAMRYYGGVPKYLVPDNMRSAVKRHTNREFELQALYEDLQDFYGYVVLPAHKSAPTEKNDVEKEVHLSYDWILSELEEHANEYHSMNDVRQAVSELLSEQCELEFRKTGLNRREWFYAVDYPGLRPLPKKDFNIYAYEYTTVRQDYHVHIKGDNHKYSVPFQYIGKNVMMKYTQTHLRIFNMERQLIAEWPRSHGNVLNNVHTNDKHRPVAHQVAVASKTRDKNWILEKAREVGPNTEQYIKSYMANYRYPEQSYDGCIGIITMTWGSKKGSISRELMEKICKEGIELRVYNYGFVKNRVAAIRNGNDSVSAERLLQNPANVRGKTDY